MISEESVPIDRLLEGLTGHTRQDKFIRTVLKGLREEGHTTVEKVVFGSWEPILVPGDPAPLYLVLSGNASVALPRGLASDPDGFTRILMRVAASDAPINMLNDLADSHPLVLCKGDLIGEFEYVQRRPPVSHVIAGTFFKSPQTRMRLRTTLLRLPDDSPLAARASLHVMTEKLVLLNHLLLPTLHRGLDRINNILACCFAGLFPVYRGFYRAADGSPQCRILSPDSSQALRDDKRYVCLGRLDPEHDAIGIEISTSYLLRCFGFAAREGLTADLNGFDLVVYSEDQARNHSVSRDHGAQLKLDRHTQFARQHWAGRLGQESMLFFLKRGIARDFCAAYGVDLHHSGFEGAAAAAP
jgi:hypothetical protein